MCVYVCVCGGVSRGGSVGGRAVCDQALAAHRQRLCLRPCDRADRGHCPSLQEELPAFLPRLGMGELHKVALLPTQSSFPFMERGLLF